MRFFNVTLPAPCSSRRRALGCITLLAVYLQEVRMSLHVRDSVNVLLEVSQHTVVYVVHIAAETRRTGTPGTLFLLCGLQGQEGWGVEEVNRVAFAPAAFMAVECLCDRVQVGTGKGEDGQAAAAGGRGGHHRSAQRLQLTGHRLVQGLPVRHPQGAAQIYVWDRPSRLHGGFLLQTGQHVVQEPVLHVQRGLEIADIDFSTGT